MWIGAVRAEIFISDSTCLKHKRSVISSLKDRIRNSFNASVAEVDEQDKWQKAVIGIAVVGFDKMMLNSALDRIVDMIRDDRRAQLIDYKMEIL